MPSRWVITGTRGRRATAALVMTSSLAVPLITGSVVAVDEPSTGTAVVFVVTRPEGVTGEFGFTDPRDSSGASTVSGSDRIEIDGLAPGRYEVSVVDAPPGWIVEGWTCTDGGPEGSSFHDETATFDIQAGEEAVCFWRALAPGSANVFVRDLSGNPIAGYLFTDPRDPAGETTGGVGGSRLLEFAPVSPGLHPVELVGHSSSIDVEGWVCTDWGAGHSEFLDVNLALFDIQPGEAVTCFWTADRAGVIDVVALTDPPDIEGSFVFNDVADPSGETTIALSSGTPHSFVDLPQGRHAVTLREHPDGLTLRTIECHHPSDETSSLVSLDTRTALVQTDTEGTVVCLFRFEVPPLGGGAGSSDTGPADESGGPSGDGDPGDDDDEPDPDPTVIVPRAGRWTVTNRAATIVCSRAPNQRLRKVTSTGRITVRDGGSTLVARDIFDGQTAPIRLHRRDGVASHYDGRVRIRRSGARVNLTVELTAVTRERMVGTLTGTVRVAGVGCALVRDVEFDLAGGAG